MTEERKDPATGELLSGALNIFGLKIDLGELLTSSEGLQNRLQELRETLKAAGGRETLSGAQWRQGAVGITGHIRTRGLLGDREFHLGTTGKPEIRMSGRARNAPPEVIEPPVDVFDEGQQITIVADVPGVALKDFELKVEGRVVSLSTKPTARRSYQKELRLEADVEPESLQTTCHNGVLEIRLRKKPAAASES